MCSFFLYMSDFHKKNECKLCDGFSMRLHVKLCFGLATGQEPFCREDFYVVFTM